jgi:hypothetical protein
MYDLWNDNGKSPPELMQTATIALVPPGPPADMDGNNEVDFIDYGIWAQYYGNDCTFEECGQANLDDGDDIINEGDLRIFCENWLLGK